MVVDASLTPLGAEDARILALENGPIRGHTLKVLIVDDDADMPPLEALRAQMTRRLPALERWTQRLVPAPGTASGLAWQDDPDFDIERHVRLRRTGQPVDEPGLRRIVAEVMTVPLDRTHPLWSLDVLPPMTDGRWAMVWKVHHCLADGMAVIRAGSSLLWDEAETGSDRPARPRPSRAGASAQVAAGARLTRVAGYRGLVLREFRRVRELTPLAGEVGPDRDVAFVRCTLDELRRVGKTIGPEVTVNDVLLAAVTGGLRGWMQTHEARAGGLKVQVPVSMHPREGDDTSGNRDSFLLVSLPVAEPDPVARVRSVSRATRLRKNRHDARAIYALRASLSHAPAAVRRALQHVVQGPHEYSLNISNVPGPSGSISVLGRHVHALYTLAEVAPHHGLRVAAVSLEGSLYLGLCADPQVVPGLDGLAAGIRASVDELQDQLGTASPR